MERKPTVRSSRKERTRRYRQPLLATNQQVGIAEVVNPGTIRDRAKFNVFSSSGSGMMSMNVNLPSRGARHLIVNPAGLNFSSGPVSSFGLSGSSGALSAVSVVYFFDSGYEYAYAPPVGVYSAKTQWTEYNTYLGQENQLVLSNSGDLKVKQISITIFSLDGAVAQKLETSLLARATSAFDLSLLPVDTYGAIKVESPTSTKY